MELYPSQPNGMYDDRLASADPRLRELDRATTRAYADLGEAIETAALQGVPSEVIARYTGLPTEEVRLTVADMLGAETLC